MIFSLGLERSVMVRKESMKRQDGEVDISRASHQWHCVVKAIMKDSDFPQSIVSKCLDHTTKYQHREL